MDPLKPNATIGIFGGGQLGRMLAVAAAQLGFRTHIYSDVEGPACEVSARATIAEYSDANKVIQFARSVDILTFEFENIPLETARLAAEHGRIAPNAKALEVAQDRLTEKTFISDLAIQVAPFAEISSPDDFAAAIEKTGLPARLKTRRLGYDGKGQVKVTDGASLNAAFEAINHAPAILEGHVDFEIEVSVIAVRDWTGHTVFYDLAENKHRDGILDTSTVPATLPDQVLIEAHAAAQRIVDALDYVGVLAVELFILPEAAASSRVMVNEIAPRVHNSGHWTLDGCQISQFENHIRAVAGWPLASTERHSDAVMTNLIGEDVNAWRDFSRAEHTSVHLYGKAEARPGRKMGHITRISPLRRQSNAKT